MAVKVVSEIEGEEIVRRALEAIGAKADDFEPAFKAAQPEFYRIEEENLNSENASGKSGKWEELSESYKEEKIRRGLPEDIEKASKVLFESLTGEAPGSVTIITKTEAAFGTDLPYAKAQHFGLEEKNLPARPLIDLSEAQMQEIARKMAEAKIKDFGLKSK
jgi:phage gpG-like protein